MDKTGFFILTLCLGEHTCYNKVARDRVLRDLLRGVKWMKSKDFTLYLCSLMPTGHENCHSVWLEMQRIPSSVGLECPTWQIFAKKACLNNFVFLKWFRVFLVHIKKNHSFSVSLVLGNCGLHETYMSECSGPVATLPLCTTARRYTSQQTLRPFLNGSLFTKEMCFWNW